MKLTLKVDSSLVSQGMEDLRSEPPKIGRRRMRTTMDRIRRRMQEYPPEPTGQSIESAHPVLGTTFKTAKGRYKRTGNFGSHWVIEGTDDGYTIANTAKHKGKEYGQYVVGDAYGTGQAKVHMGRWTLFRDVVEEEVAKMPPEVVEEIRMVTRRYE